MDGKVSVHEQRRTIDPRIIEYLGLDNFLVQCRRLEDLLSTADCNSTQSRPPKNGPSPLGLQRLLPKVRLRPTGCRHCTRFRA